MNRNTVIRHLIPMRKTQYSLHVVEDNYWLKGEDCSVLENEHSLYTVVNKNWLSRPLSL